MSGTISIEQFRGAADSLVAPLKTGAVAGAMLLAAAGLTAPAQAKQVVAAMAGTVSSGYDQTGVFGAAKTDLTNQPFTLNCVTDDGKGTGLAESSPPTSSRIDSTGSIASGNLSSATTCALTIKGKTLIFGELPANWRTSSVSRTAQDVHQLDVAESYYLSDAYGAGSVYANYYFNQGSQASYNWESPVYSTNTGTSSGSFSFDHWDVVDDASMGMAQFKNPQVASGSLTINSLSVSGGQYSASDKAAFAKAGGTEYEISQSTAEASAFKSTLFPPAVQHYLQRIYQEIFGEALVMNDQALQGFGPTYELSATALQYLEIDSSADALGGAGVGVADGSAPDVFDVLGISTLHNAIVDFTKALDPPDWNYKTVQPPSNLSMPLSGNVVVDQAVQDYLTVTSYDAAALHAHERWQAATIAGDTASAAMQLNGFAAYSELADNARAVLPADNLAVSRVLPVVNVNAVPGGAAAVAAAVNALCGQPLPQRMNDALLAVGLSQSAIDERVCEKAKAVRPETITTNVQSLQSLLAGPQPSP
jgi:hypothetical protein